MNRIDKKFAELKAKKKKALITFLTAGDPDFDTTENIVLEMERQGADVIELGVPFSDPVAEGPVIQEASLRALQGGTTLVGIFEMVKKSAPKNTSSADSNDVYQYHLSIWQRTLFQPVPGAWH